MCISLHITRPEAAIADASRVKIRDIVPTYLTADSYLDAAKFKLSSAEGNLGSVQNFDNKAQEGQCILQGIGQENITGVMPLYLFDKHWNIAKRKVQHVYGFMCTLDVMGY